MTPHRCYGIRLFRSGRPGVFLGKGVLKIATLLKSLKLYLIFQDLKSSRYVNRELTRLLW